MKRFTLSISAISLTSLGLLFASACSTDDTTSDGEGGYVNSGGNTYMNRGGGTSYGGTGNGGAAAGGKAATGGAANGGAANGGAATGGKASTGGAATAGASTGGAATAGNAGNGGTAGAATGGAATAGEAGNGGTAGSTSTGGAATAGNAGKIGTAGSTSTAGKTSVAGSTSTGGTANAGTAGKTNTGTAGTGTLGNCGTVATSLAMYCTPPTTVALPNTSAVATRDPASDPSMGTLQYHIYNGVAQLYGTVAAAGAFWQGTPFTDATCSGAGVNATGKTGMTVTVVNNVTTPVSVQLIVLDQAGTTAPYPVVTMTATVNVAGSATSTQTIPFSNFVSSCTLPTGVSSNYATIRQIGFGFGAAGAVDVTLSNISFTSS